MLDLDWPEATKQMQRNWIGKSIGANVDFKIDGTNINYPVMQNGDFYLHRNVYKNYSSSGTPYLAEHCNLKTSDNLIIYGHHMKNKAMFGALEDYKKEEL